MKILNHPPMEDVTLAHIFYALGDESRLRIMKNLLKAEQPLTCMQAVEGITNLPVSTRSHCFQVLRQAGLVYSEKKGRECYNALRLAELEAAFPQLIAMLTRHLV